MVALLTVPFCGTFLYYNNDQSELLDSVPNNIEEDIIMENDLDKDQDHKIDQDFLDLIVKNYRHMKRVEIYITRDELALNLSPGRPIVSIPNVQILSELSLSMS